MKPDPIEVRRAMGEMLSENTRRRLRRGQLAPTARIRRRRERRRERRRVLRSFVLFHAVIAAGLIAAAIFIVITR